MATTIENKKVKLGDIKRAFDLLAARITAATSAGSDNADDITALQTITGTHTAQIQEIMDSVATTAEFCQYLGIEQEQASGNSNGENSSNDGGNDNSGEGSGDGNDGGESSGEGE